MSRWIDRFNQHNFINILNDLENKINEVSLPSDANEDVVLEYARFSKVVKYIRDITDSVDPDLTTIHIFNETSGNLQAALNEFNAFSSNKSIGNIQNANNNIDNILNSISRAFVYYSKPAKSKLKDIVKSYSDILDQHREDYQSAAEKEVNKLSASSTQKINELDNSSAELKNNLDEIRNKIDKLQEELTSLEQQAQSQLAEFNTQFQNSQSEKSKKADDLFEKINEKHSNQLEKNSLLLNDQLDKEKKKFNDLFQKSNDYADNEFRNLTSKAGSILDVLRKLQDDAETVFGVVQNTAQAGAHKKYASEERRTANLYRYGAISLMLLAVAVLVAPEVLKFTSEQQTVSQFIININWDSLLKRLPVSVILFAPAFYLARESNKHRQNEFQNRRRELTLKTLDPYLALINDETKSEELKCQIARDIFGENKTTINQDENTSDILAQLSNLVKNLSSK